MSYALLKTPMDVRVPSWCLRKPDLDSPTKRYTDTTVRIRFKDRESWEFVIGMKAAEDVAEAAKRRQAWRQASPPGPDVSDFIVVLAHFRSERAKKLAVVWLCLLDGSMLDNKYIAGWFIREPSEMSRIVTYAQKLLR